jgi:hypothetical protein
VASKVFDGPSLREQSDAVMGFVGIIMRALEDPMRSVSSIRSIGSSFICIVLDGSLKPHCI